MLSLLEYRSAPHNYEEPLFSADGFLSEQKLLAKGTLPPERGVRRCLALLAALSIEGSGLAAIYAQYALSAILLLLGMAAVAWCYRTESPDSTKRLIQLLGVATLIGITVAVVESVQPHYTVIAQTGGPESGETEAGKRTVPGADGSYTSVILWPKPPRVVRMVSLPPLTRSADVARPAKPLVIPFDGVYWYLRSPAKVPGRNAHSAHGSPTKVAIHSADWHPLVMEAHQLLASPIDAVCCRELDMSILNADNRPGAIRIAIVLIDSSSPHIRSEDIGTQAVRCSMPPGFSLNRPPTLEVLKYPMPRASDRRQFDEIEVIFLPSRERSLGGAQIAIRSFRLLPQ